MKRLIEWWKAEPTRKRRDHIRVEPTRVEAVTMDSVDAAELPDKDIERETKSALGELTHAVVTLARSSYELRIATANSAISHVTGGR